MSTKLNVNAVPEGYVIPTTGAVTGNVKYTEVQSLTDVQKNNVLTTLGIADERVNLTILCDDPSAVIGATVSVTYDDNTVNYTWSGSTLVIVIPMMEEYTIHFSDITRYTKPEDISYISKKNRVRNITVSYDSGNYIDLSMRNINGEVLTARETANCYVVHETGFYEIPLVYGCAITDGEVNVESYTQVSGTYTKPFYNYLNNQIASPHIETDTSMEITSAEILWKDSTEFVINSEMFMVNRGDYKFLRFQVDAMPTLGGNAMVAIKDEAGQIMWSWHLWAYPFTLTTKAHTNTNNKTYNMLDVNLGWVKHAVDSKYGTCPYFQWGRKDPMVRAAAYNSTTQASITGSFRIATTATSLAATIQNPNVFNTQGANNNWWTDNGTAVNFYNYWDASQTTTGNADKTIVKTVYDPCPVGFSIPCGNTFLGFSTSSGGTWDYGWTWDERYFAASGGRFSASGGLYSVGSFGYYWLASSNSQAYACNLFFNSSLVNPQNNNYRAYGFAVCPIACPQNL